MRLTPAPLPPIFRQAETLWGAGNLLGYIEAFRIPRVAVGFRIYYYNWATYRHANPNQQVIEMRRGAYAPWDNVFAVVRSPFYRSRTYGELVKIYFAREIPLQRFGLVPSNPPPNMNYDVLFDRMHIFAFGDVLADGGVYFMSIPAFYADLQKMVEGTCTIAPANVLQFPLVDVQGNPYCFLLSADCRDGRTPLLLSGFMDFNTMRPLQKRLLDLLPLAQKLPLAKFLEAATPLVAERMKG